MLARFQIQMNDNIVHNVFPYKLNDTNYRNDTDEPELFKNLLGCMYVAFSHFFTTCFKAKSGGINF